MKHGNRIKLKDRTLENDIKYRGFISYRYLRIIAWLFLIFAQCAAIIKFNMSVNKASVPYVQGAFNFFDWFAYLPLPLFLVANFAYILQHRNKIKHLLFFYGAICLLIYAAANFVTLHYLHGIVATFKPDVTYYQSSKFAGHLFINMGQTGYVFNIFIDLFLCTLIIFFIFYTPKKFFTGKKIHIFRWMVLLPLLYEIAGVAIKLCYFTGDITQVPSFLFFLLPSKPPLMFLSFFVLVLLMKYAEFRRRKHQDPEFYKEHIKTNAHSLRVSIIMMIIFILMGIIDIVAYIITTALIITRFNVPEMNETVLMVGMSIAQETGFGKTAVFILIAPFMLLFSYNKSHKNPKIDTFIPIAAIAIIVIVYLEGFFQVFTHNVPQLLDKIREFFDNLLGGE